LIAEAEPMMNNGTTEILSRQWVQLQAVLSDIASTANILESSMDSFQMNAQPKHPSSYASAKRNSSELTPYLPSSEASQYKAGEVKDTPIARTNFLYPPLYTDIDEALLDCLDNFEDLSTLAEERTTDDVEEVNSISKSMTLSSTCHFCGASRAFSECCIGSNNARIYFDRYDSELASVS